MSRLEATLRIKEAELARLQASTKATSLNEMKIEAETYYQEVRVEVVVFWSSIKGEEHGGRICSPPISLSLLLLFFLVSSYGILLLIWVLGKYE